ncbi:Hypothetical predicted protein, partial [Pelobates cultripes]
MHSQTLLHHLVSQLAEETGKKFLDATLSRFPEHDVMTFALLEPGKPPMGAITPAAMPVSHVQKGKYLKKQPWK